MSQPKQPEVEVLAVVLNCHRPGNIPFVVRALREQTVKCHVALVDCGQIHSKSSHFRMTDSHFDISGKDPGPCARFLPSLALPQFPYTFFAVDDHLPGPRCVEFMLEEAKQIEKSSGRRGRFISVGQDGRNIHNGKIVKRKAKLGDTRRMIDFVTSSEICLTENIVYAVKFLSIVSSAGLSTFEDDLILSFGISREFLSASCWLTSRPPSPEYAWNMKRLPSPQALSARPDHDERRQKFIEMARRI